MIILGQNAKEAYTTLSLASTEQKNNALRAAAKAIRESANEIMQANEKDLQIAKKAEKPASYLDRLALSPVRIESMAKGLEAVAELPDPVGKILANWDRPNGLKINRVSVPLGVIGVIYEARPNVTADAGALCLKSGNAVILRCGSDSFNSSRAIEKALQKGLETAGLPKTAIQLVPTSDRSAVTEMLQMTDYIDVIIPRGGRSLTEKIKNESRIPTFQHLDGNCHTYIHASANPQMAVDVVVNAKMRRTGICGATESLVIDEAIIDVILPKIVEALTAQNCEIRGDERAQLTDKRIRPANPADWFKEYLEPIISVKTVSGLEAAIEHVNLYSSHHTDAIIADDAKTSAEFLNRIDSAIVMHNASTQFADGGEFGMGAEIGISTGRLHARGPVGVEQLTTFKYIVEGNGQTRPA
ncbi:MAG: glutamate-5-semialdehyde dehydrogenase [Alphaproteobacteria bacterium CG11_big_fil_rev_8_21_14_0_20_44_7]|nr:MAG: glutamate-5-semialdehyde dehydrogenase [Alphaproteobacteria bacterium CG11_big_fil_rev_8_21_14_0_20_44_7]